LLLMLTVSVAMGASAWSVGAVGGPCILILM
jgi:hypothetical protein